MAYTINLTDGTIFAVVADGTINTGSSVSLPGKNYAGYGEFLDENFIQMLENFSSPATSGGLPTNAKLGAPLEGQLWWDSTNLSLKVYNGSLWKVAGGTTASASAPSSPNVGDLWWNTSSSQLNVWSGSAWIVIGPSSVAGTGVQATTITDNASVVHPVITFTISNNVVAILSQDATFTPGSAITGWGSSGLQQVKPGLNLSTGAGGIYDFVGTATQAEYADLAERFAADAEYAAGTVVEIGGSAEITQCDADLSNNVLGVISTNAAYLMNANSGSDATHPPVAMTGRVPVKAVGQISKGNRLVSAGRGMVRAAQPGEATAFNTVGRALADKLDLGDGMVEAIVTVK
jgi:hypothetical protein